jgi:hypothetical protein
MKVTYRIHALRRMFERGITEADARSVLDGGEVIAIYPDDRPYPSRLLLGWWNNRPLHVVAAYNAREEKQIVITVYEPDPALWRDGFTRRKP